jgi:hypothetical protein
MSSCTAMHIGELAGKCVPLSSVCSELDSADSAVVWYMLQKLSFYPGGVNLLLLPGLKEPARLLHLVPDGAARAGVLVVVDLRLHLPVAVLCLAEVPVAPQGRGQARQGCAAEVHFIPTVGSSVEVALCQSRGLPPLPVGIQMQLREGEDGERASENGRMLFWRL